MSETLCELPVADAMTAIELRAHEAALVKLIGTPRAHVHITTMAYDEPAYIACSPDFPADQGRATFRGATWPEVLSAAYAWASTRQTVWRAERIRLLALAIIDLTDAHGACEVHHLRARQFTQHEITTLHAEACRRANEMAGGAPFSVVGLS